MTGQAIQVEVVNIYDGFWVVKGGEPLTYFRFPDPQFYTALGEYADADYIEEGAEILVDSRALIPRRG